LGIAACAVLYQCPALAQPRARFATISLNAASLGGIQLLDDDAPDNMTAACGTRWCESALWTPQLSQRLALFERPKP